MTTRIIGPSPGSTPVVTGAPASSGRALPDDLLRDASRRLGHAAATGRPCVTLDAWAASPPQLRGRAAEAADGVATVTGVPVPGAVVAGVVPPAGVAPTAGEASAGTRMSCGMSTSTPVPPRAEGR